MKRTNKLWLTVLLTVLVTVLLAVGLTAAAENTAAFEDAAVISTNVPQTLSFSGNGRETVYLKFTPEDAGSYTLSCTGGDAIFYTWLFDADGELLESGSYFNGFLGYGLEAGKTYFYQIDSYDNIIAEEDELLIGASDLRLAELTKIIRERGGIPVPAHINRGSNGLLINLGMMPEELDFTAVEVWRALPCAHTPQVGKVILHSSDAHNLGDILEPEITTVLPEPSAGAFLDMLRRGAAQG